MNSKSANNYFKEQNVQFKEDNVLVEKNRVHYIETGNDTNPTIIFLHGSPGSWDAFKKYLTDSLLLSKFRLISIDRPGFGYSDFNSSKNLGEQSKIVNSAIQQLNLKKPITLVGHSYGGPLIVKLALDQPNSFSNLVILAGALDPSAENPEKWRSILKIFPLKYLLPGAFRPSNSELWMLKDDLKILKPVLNNITENILIIHGTKDRLVPFSNVSFMKAEFVNAKKVDVVTLENVDHFIPWTHFETIRNSLLSL